MSSLSKRPEGSFTAPQTPRKMETRDYIPNGNPEVAKRGRRIEIFTWQREEDRKWPVLGQTRKIYSFWFGCSGARCTQPKTSKDCVSGSQWQWTRCFSFHDNKNHKDHGPKFIIHMLWAELCPSKNSCVEVLIHNVMVFGDRAFGRLLLIYLDVVTRVGPSW